MLVRTRLQVPSPTRCLALALLVAGCAGGPAGPPRRAPAPSPPAPRAEREPIPADWRPYAVRPGDTLGRIAACHGVALGTLANANRLPDPDRLPAGMELHVPPRNHCPETPPVAAAPPPPAPAPPLRPATVPPPRAAAAAPPVADVARPPVAAPPPASVRADPVQEAARERAADSIAASWRRYEAADFTTALAEAEDAGRALDAAPPDATSGALRAEAHLLAAMAAVGLEQRERALAELRRAFALDPGLEVPPEFASPRIEELVGEVRAGKGG